MGPDEGKLLMCAILKEKGRWTLKAIQGFPGPRLRSQLVRQAPTEATAVGLLRAFGVQPLLGKELQHRQHQSNLWG